MLRPLASFSLSVVSFMFYFVTYSGYDGTGFDYQSHFYGEPVVLLQCFDCFCFRGYHHHCVIAIAEIVGDVHPFFHEVVKPVNNEVAERLAGECSNR